VSFVFLPNLKIISGITALFGNATNSTFSTFEFSGWSRTIANPITDSDFSIYQPVVWA